MSTTMLSDNPAAVGDRTLVGVDVPTGTVSATTPAPLSPVAAAVIRTYLEDTFAVNFPRLVQYLERHNRGAQVNGLSMEDIASAAYERVLAHPCAKESVEGYLRRTAVNLLIDQYRRAEVKRRKLGREQVATEEFPDILEEIEGGLLDPEGEAIGGDVVVTVARAAESMSLQEREALAYTIQGMSPSEIAKVTGRTPASVKASLHRARTKVKEALNV